MGPAFAAMILGTAAPLSIGTPTQIAQATDTSSTGSSVSSMATNAAITAGNLIVIGIMANTSNSVSVTGVTIGTDTLTKAASVKSPDTVNEGSIWYIENAAGQSSGQTITLTLAGAAGASTFTVNGAQVSGIISASAKDVTGTGATNSGAPSAASGTLAQAKEILFGHAGNIGGSTPYSGASGFTNIAATTGANQISNLDYKVVAATTTTTFSPNYSSWGSRNTAVVAAFKGN